MANVFNLFWPMVLHVNVYPFKLGKETIKSILGPHTLSTEYQASDCFATLAVSHSFQTFIEFEISNLLCNVYVQWPMSTDVLFIICLHMTRI
jgi:hypothetical protein